MRIPIYGMTLQICAILIGMYFIASCSTPKQYDIPKPQIKYKFPNILDTQPKLA